MSDNRKTDPETGLPVYYHNGDKPTWHDKVSDWILKQFTNGNILYLAMIVFAIVVTSLIAQCAAAHSVTPELKYEEHSYCLYSNSDEEAIARCQVFYLERILKELQHQNAQDGHSWRREE